MQLTHEFWQFRLTISAVFACAQLACTTDAPILRPSTPATELGSTGDSLFAEDAYLGEASDDAENTPEIASASETTDTTETANSPDSQRSPQACKTSKACAVGLVCDVTAGYCVECVTAADCAAGQQCINSLCHTTSCVPGSAACVAGNARQVCQADGLQVVLQACDSDQACEGGVCKATVCAAGLATCAGNLVVQCNATGLASAVSADCALTDQTCVAGQCATLNCTPGATLCADTKTLATCKPDGSAYDKAACPSAQACSSGKCMAKICKPGDDNCQAAVVMHCNPSGTAWSAAADCGAQKLVCVNGACAAKP